MAPWKEESHIANSMLLQNIEVETLSRKSNTETHSVRKLSKFLKLVLIHQIKKLFPSKIQPELHLMPTPEHNNIKGSLLLEGDGAWAKSFVAENSSRSAIILSGSLAKILGYLEPFICFLAAYLSSFVFHFLHH